MKCLIFLSFLTIFLTTIKADYFWRDFYGEIPSDAVKGGLNADGKPTYIGQTFDRQFNILMPGTIYIDDKYVYYGKLPQGRSSTWCRILCSHDTSDLMWVKTNMTGLHWLTECNQIIGGFYETATMLIGKANYQGLTYIGRIFDSDDKDWHFFSSVDLGNTVFHLQEFEVLTHGCTNHTRIES